MVEWWRLSSNWGVEGDVYDMDGAWKWNGALVCLYGYWKTTSVDKSKAWRILSSKSALDMLRETTAPMMLST